MAFTTRIKAHFNSVDQKIMRDDFSKGVKELLAKRVGFLCSNPGCRQPTSGPQSDPLGSVNLGVAAHITGASPKGPRYDKELSPKARQSPENGIWLCQTDAKLIDNDESRYTVSKLRTWKAGAELEAQTNLERRNDRNSGLTSALVRMEQLMPMLLQEMRDDLSNYPLKREFFVLQRGCSIGFADNYLVYYYDDHPHLDDKLTILENEQLVQNVAYGKTKRYRILEPLARYLQGELVPSIGGRLIGEKNFTTGAWFMSSLAKAAIIFLFVIPAFSQARTGTQRAADNCEYIYATIDALADRIRRFSDGDSVLIIVAGSKRSSDRPLDIQRVTRLKEFLVDFRNAKPEQIVWGIGPASSTDFSYMRFYADGKMLTELTLHPRSLLCTGEGEALPKKSRGTPRTGLTKRDE